MNDVSLRQLIAMEKQLKLQAAQCASRAAHIRKLIKQRKKQARQLEPLK